MRLNLVMFTPIQPYTGVPAERAKNKTARSLSETRWGLSYKTFTYELEGMSYASLKRASGLGFYSFTAAVTDTISFIHSTNTLHFT